MPLNMNIFVIKGKYHLRGENGAYSFGKGFVFFLSKLFHFGIIYDSKTGAQHMEEFFQIYGPGMIYVIMFLGALIEGESIVLSCSLLSYKYPVVSLPILMLLAFLGSMTADQILFFVGRRYGPGMIARRPHWHARVDRIFDYMRRHSTLFVFSFRFIYGIRTISPIVIGASGIDVRRFAILNCLAAFVWAVLSCSAGYLLGYLFADRVEDFLENFEQYKRAVGMVVIAALCVAGGLWWWRQKKAEQGA